jgi:HEAT repeat protein
MMRWKAALGGGLLFTSGSILADLRAFSRGETPEAGAPASSPPEHVDFPAAIPAPIRPPLQRIVTAIGRANARVRDCLKGLSTVERRDLIESIPQHAAPPPLLALDFVARPRRTWPEVLDLLTLPNLDGILYAGIQLEKEIRAQLFELAAAAPPSFREKVVFSHDGATLVVAGFADDVHEERNAILTVDLGGNDRYTGRHGAGIGYAAAFVDLEGSDLYDLPDASLGVGILGIGLAWDIGGINVVRARSLCLGSGVAGVGLFESAGAVTRQGMTPGPGGVYEATAMSQGFGVFGLGAMVSRGEGDLYRSRYLSMGSGLSGGAGLLADFAGLDTFESDGLAASLESDAILRSRSQGFGGRIGFLDAEVGGVGILTAYGGDDEFRAGTEAQGCGVDGGAGILFHHGGRNGYRLSGYGQGWGANAGCGALLDGSGDDLYLCLGGAMQGGGIEGGMGFLLDEAGEDTYLARSGRPGTGRYGGLGALIDRSEPDRYEFAASNSGGELESRGMGLLLDVGGPNGFLVEGVGPRARSAGLFQVFAEQERRQEARSEQPVTAVGRPLRFGELIESALREASGLAEAANREARARAAASLDFSAAETLGWAAGANRRLRDAEVRVLASLAAKFPVEAHARLVPAAGGASPQAARNALRILGESGLAGGGQAVMQALSKRELVPEAAHAAAQLNLKEAASELMVLCASDIAAVRRSAAAALAKLGGPEALATAQVLLASPDPVMRTAAAELFARIGAGSEAALSGIAERAAEPEARAAMLALARIGSPAALHALGQRLEDRKPGVRLEAVRGLYGRCPPEFRPLLDARLQDDDPRVRAVAFALFVPG